MKINSFSEIKNIVSELDEFEKYSIFKEINTCMLDYLQEQKIDIYLFLEKILPLLSINNNKRLLNDIENILTNKNITKTKKTNIENLDLSGIDFLEKLNTNSVIISNKNAKEIQDQDVFNEIIESEESIDTNKNESFELQPYQNKNTNVGNFINSLNFNKNHPLGSKVTGDNLNKTEEYESVPINEGIKAIIPLITKKGIDYLKNATIPTEIQSLLKLIDGSSNLEEINEKYFSKVNSNLQPFISTFKKIGFPSQFVIEFLDKIMEMETTELITFVKNPDNPIKNNVRIKLGDLLLYMKVVNNDQIKKILSFQQKSLNNKDLDKQKALLGNIILSLKILNENQINHALSIQKWYNSLEKRKN
ncbi:MAG: hypothetical protein U0457_04895 [Candidatus Sericytochromatia bacterium]